MKLFTKITRFTFSSRSSFIITIEVFLGILICLVSLLLFFVFAKEIMEKDSALLDQQFSLFVYTLRTPFLTQLMLAITAFGDKLLLLFAATLSIIFAIRNHKKEAVLFCLALAMGAFLNTSFKAMAQRPRPYIAPLVVEQYYSFPSGHAMNSFIFYSLIAYFSYHFFRNKKLTLVATCFSAGLILLIGFSRIYLGVHYLTDVIAGYLAGFWWFITILLVEHTLIFYKLFRKTE